MKRTVSDLAISGGRKMFPETLPVGQISVPAWSRFKAMADGIFDRRYYSNHGVLAQEFEKKLCNLLGVKHAVTMTNATIGLSLACKALGLPSGGRVIVPAFTFAASVQALTWAGLEPVFCDVDPLTHNISAATVAPLLHTPGVCAILGVHLWGNVCDIEGLQELANSQGILLFFDAAHAVGCTHHGMGVGGFGKCEIFSFHATKILSATEGGCVATNDDVIAERLRNLRSSYGRRATVPIPVNANGRFSEMQAAFGLLSLEDFPQNCERNKQRMECYRSGLEGVPGIHFLLPTPDEKHNFQYVVFEIDEVAFGLSRDQLVHVLEAENILARRYFIPGMHRSPPYSTEFPQYLDALPGTDALCKRVMQLPSGEVISLEVIQKICEIIRFIQHHAQEIRERL